MNVGIKCTCRMGVTVLALLLFSFSNVFVNNSRDERQTKAEEKIEEKGISATGCNTLAG